MNLHSRTAIIREQNKLGDSLFFFIGSRATFNLLRVLYNHDHDRLTATSLNRIWEKQNGHSRVKLPNCQTDILTNFLFDLVLFYLNQFNSNRCYRCYRAYIRERNTRIEAQNSTAGHRQRSTLQLGARKASAGKRYTDTECAQRPS